VAKPKNLCGRGYLLSYKGKQVTLGKFCALSCGICSTSPTIEAIVDLELPRTRTLKYHVEGQRHIVIDTAGESIAVDNDGQSPSEELIGSEEELSVLGHGTCDGITAWIAKYKPMLEEAKSKFEAGKCESRLVAKWCEKATKQMERLTAKKAKIATQLAKCPAAPATGSAADPKAARKCKWLQRHSSWITKRSEHTSKKMEKLQCAGASGGKAEGAAALIETDHWEEVW
jgi:hypothetical protein